ncbi:MAG: glycoside hydrolase [Chloroflexi bacterium]|nr:glycoside hydrolase [Chloroflexota bacterium]
MEFQEKQDPTASEAADPTCDSHTGPSRREALQIGLVLAAGWVLPLRINVVQQGVQKRIYIATDDHTDYFWTANDADYRQAFIEMLDYYLDLADTTAGNPSDYQCRFNTDGTLWIWEYERNKSSQAFARLINRIKDGHISVPMNALVVCLGGAPAEAVLRGMYYAGKLERKHDFRFSMAIAMENQTLSLGLISLWAGAGARFSWKGICQCDTLVSANIRPREIYWAQGLDGRRVLMKWNSMLGDNMGIGGYAEARNPWTIVDYLDQDPEFRARYPYDVIGAFGRGWDDFKTLTDDFILAAQNQSNASRRVIVSNEHDFFVDFETTYGTQIETAALSFGNDWDLFCASLAEESAAVKRAVELLRSSEALASLVTLYKPLFMSGWKTLRDAAWMALGLYWEHNFGQAYGVWDVYGLQRVAWQKAQRKAVKKYGKKLLKSAAATLGELIKGKATKTRFFVFNPLQWVRSDYADYKYSGSEDIYVIDRTDKSTVPHQFVTIKGKRYLRIFADNVPAVGYKVFEVRAGSGVPFSDAATVAGNVLENDRYRVTVAQNGAITSWIDKTRGNTEMARDAGGRFINDLGSGGGTITVESAGPVTVTLLATSNGPVAHTTRITLVRNLDRIDIDNNISQAFDDTQTWRYSFNLDNPDIWHEEVGAILRARLTSNGGHYSTQNARYDWLTLNHFVHVQGGAGTGVTLSNWEAYFMRLGASTPYELDSSKARLDVLAGGRVGGDGSFGIPNQAGYTKLQQRFALTVTDGYNPAECMRFALGHQNPFVTGTVVGSEPVLSAKQFSLVSMSDPDVMLWALKPADDGGGLVARMWNVTDTPRSVQLGLTDHPIVEAQTVTHVETPTGSAVVAGGGLSTTVGAHAMDSYLLTDAQSAAAAPLLGLPAAPAPPAPDIT